MKAGNRPAFLAFVSDTDSQATLATYAESQKLGTAAVQQGDIYTATAYLKTHPSPHILIVDVPNAKDAPEAFDRLADVCEPGTRVIATGSINEYSFYTWLVDIGISHYLLKPLTQEAVAAAVTRIHSPAAPGGVGETKQAGKVIAVLGTRGGVGATTFAVNLASVLGSERKRQTALIDLDPQHGTVAMALDIDPGRGLRDALEKPDRIDGLFLERVLVRYNDRLSVLSTEEALDEMVTYHEQAAPVLIREMQKKFDTVVVDLPRSLHVLTRQMLQAADEVILVTELTLPGIRDVLRLMDFFRDVLKIKPPQVIANRVGIAAKHEMGRAEFEKGFGGKLAAVIPFDVDVFAEGAGGNLLIEKNRNTPALKPLKQLAESLAPVTEAATGKESPAKPKGFSLFRKPGA